jgi:4-carboxymuconolactone decarboxylase
MTNWIKSLERRRHSYSFATVVALAFSCASLVKAQDRMPPIPADKLTEAQKAAVAEYRADRNSDPGGPYIAMLRSPELMSSARALSDYLRFKSVLPQRLRELVILTAARQWTIQFEWAVQYQAAIASGLKPEIIKAIAEGRRPPEMAEDEQIIYDLCTELQRNQSVSDVTYNRALEKFGEQGVVDTVATVGYFTMLGMILNTARIPPPANAASTLVPLPANK